MVDQAIKKNIEDFLKKSILQIGRLLPRRMLVNLQNKMIYEPRIRNLGLKNGEIPLFDTVFFEVRTKCNGSCVVGMDSVTDCKCLRNWRTLL